MGDSVTLLIGILIAMAIPIVLVVVVVIVAVVNGSDRNARSQGDFSARTAPPGWYADPLHEADQRYWDGARWTAHVD